MSHHYSGPDLGFPHGGNRLNLPDAPVARESFFVTHFFTVKDQEKSKDFYVRILGGKAINPENPCYIKLANSWIVLNSGGGPTHDKPEVLLETPQDLNRVNAFLNRRVADIGSVTNNGAPKERSSSPNRSTTALGMGRDGWT